MRYRKQTRPGFTLIEILLVLAIIGMLAGVTIFAIGGIGKKARRDTTEATLETVANALDTYQLQIGHYPTEEEGNLDALRIRPSWNNALNYEVQTATSDDETTPPFRLWSNGPDGMSDTEDDVKYWPEEEGTGP